MQTLTDQAAAVAEGRIAPLELVNAALSSIERVQPSLNAFTHTIAERAVQRAQELAGRAAQGPLHGVPVAVKELFDVAGVATTGCCAAYADRVARRDSAVAERLQEAGAIIVAKTNQHELACGTTTQVSSFGPARNPWNTARIPGGSSGGSAAAVASGVVALAMGSDTAGSIRIPASMCGVTGLKPTHGAVSMRGAMPLAASLDAAGPLARSASDCRLAFQVLIGFDPDDPMSVAPPALSADPTLRGLRMGMLSSFAALADSDVRTALEAASRTFAEIGIRVIDMPQPSTDTAMASFGGLIRAEFADAYRDLDGDDRVHPQVAALIRVGREQHGTEYVRATELRRTVRRSFDRAFAEADLLLAPATPTAAPAADGAQDASGPPAAPHVSSITLTAPANVAGLPAMGIPIGFTPDGLPVGAQLIGPPWSEDLLLTAAEAYQSATDWHLRSPERGP